MKTQIHTGVIYLVTNHYNISNGILPHYYIGSKKCIDKWTSSEYYGSSKSLCRDINRLGSEHFSREIIETVEFSNYRDLLDVEMQHIIERNAHIDHAYYNQSCTNMAPYNPDAVSAILSKAVSQWHYMRSEEEKIATNQKISAALAGRVVGRRHDGAHNKCKDKIEKALRTYAQKSQEEKDAIIYARMLAMKDKSPEELLGIYKNRTRNLHTPETREKARQTRLSKTKPEKEAISAKRKKTLDGKTQAEIDAMCAKMSHKRSDHPQAKSLMTPRGVFKCMKDAAEHFSCSDVTIRTRCNNKKEKWKDWYFI